MNRIVLSIILLLLFVPKVEAQTAKPKINIYNNWVFGGSTGISYLAMELKKDLQQATMDMNSLPDIAYSFHLGKRLTRKYELGIEYKKSYFNGYKNYSSNVVWLMHSERFNNDYLNFEPRPIYYNTHLSMWSFEVKYNFLNFYSLQHNFLNSNMYIRAGAGISVIGVEMGYKSLASYEGTNLTHPIYEKGQGGHKHRDSYASYSAGTGLHQQLSHRWAMFIEGTLLFVSCDYLDGVHNYKLITNSDQTVSIKRVGVYDAIGMLRVGVSYSFSLPFAKKEQKELSWKVQKKGYVNEFFYDKKNNRITTTKMPFKQ